MDEEQELINIQQIKSQLNKEELMKEVEQLKFHPLFTEDKNVLNNTDDPNIEALR
jgi:hypothetical protein